MNLRDVGWVWEGHGIDPGVPPSIYGLGQGAAYFGLNRVNYIFHPNDEHAMKLLAGRNEVTCDICKRGFRWTEEGAVKCAVQADPASLTAESRNVATLSTRFANITGAYCDDLMGLMNKHGVTPAVFGEIRAGIRSINPRLKLWSVVYTHELDERDFWQAMSPHVDVVNLWIWHSAELDGLVESVRRCRRVFPDKPIVMGVYLRDYTLRAPIPVETVLGQMQRVADGVEHGQLAGFSILGAVLIDGHRPQADAIRDFVAAH